MLLPVMRVLGAKEPVDVMFLESCEPATKDKDNERRDVLEEATTCASSLSSACWSINMKKSSHMQHAACFL